MQSILRDLRNAVRALRRSPGLVAVVVLTLSLGIGASSALLAVVDRLFLQPPAGIAAPNELRRFYSLTNVTFDGLPLLQSSFGYPDFLAMRQAMEAEANVVGFTPPESVTFGKLDEARALMATYVGHDYFAFLGVSPVSGRFFAADEETMGSPVPVAILSDALWRSAFGGRGDVVGRTIQLNQRPFTIVGVAPAGFRGTDLDAADLWLPLPMYPAPPVGSVPWYEYQLSAVSGPLALLEVLARTRTASGNDHLAAIGTTVLRRPRTSRFRDSTAKLLVGPLAQALGPTVSGQTSVASALRPQLQADPSVAISGRLTAVVILLLLIACANVANLLLGRALHRRRELGVRLAIGASRWQLARQLLAESVVLAAAAGLVSVLLAAWGGSILRTVLLPTTHWQGGALDSRVALFTAAAAFFVALATGLAPALRATSVDLTRALNTGAREGMGRRATVRQGLIIVQAALSVVMLVGAGVFFESLTRVGRIDLGYDVDRLVSGTVRFRDPRGGYVDYFSHDDELGRGLADVAVRLQHAPGVDRVAISFSAPMRGFAQGPFRVPGRDSLPEIGGKRGAPLGLFVTPSYFETVGLHLLAGRLFTEADRAEPGGPGALSQSEPWRAIILGATAARALWPGDSPLGKCVQLNTLKDDCTPVVGVVADAHVTRVIETPTMLYYLPIRMLHGETIVLRAAPGAQQPVATALFRALRDRFPNADPPVVHTMQHDLDPQLRPWRLGALLFAGFGLLALIITAIGVYGVVSYGVNQRTQEMGVRLALGARAVDVQRLVLGEGVRTALIGVVVGTVLSFYAGSAVASLLYDTSPRDPVVIAGVAILLCVCAALASLGPAWRASRVDPVTSLRAE